MKKLSVQDWGRMIDIRLLLKDGTKSILLTKDLEMIREHISMNQEITFKPILRRLEDMTSEEREEYELNIVSLIRCAPEDYLDSIGIDQRGYIKSGLAIDAREVE